MSDGGGDSGGGSDKGSTDDSGGNGGGYQPGQQVNFGSNLAAYDSPPAPASGGGDPLSFTSPGEQAGFQGSGDLPSEITTGSSVGGSQYGAPSLSDFLSPGSDGGFNLSGPGPVGGGLGSPTASGDVFSTDTSGVGVPGSVDSNPLGTTAPSAGGGTSALAFAAPAGVSGTPDLSTLTTDPAGSGGAGTGVSPSDQNIFDSLNGAQTGAANQYATAQTGIDNSGQSTLPATGNGQPPSTTLSDLLSNSSSSGSKTGSSGGSTTGGSGSGVNLSTNPLGIAAAGAGLLSNLVSGNKAVPQSPALNSIGSNAAVTSAQQTAAGTALQQYITTGTLPAGYEDQVQQAAQAAKSQIISNYANRGLPTDPTKNSALAQELGQVDARLPAMREQLAQQLSTTGSGMISTGLQAAGIESGIYTTLANLENSQNTARGSAIANFASALNGGNKGGVTLNLNKAA